MHTNQLPKPTLQSIYDLRMMTKHPKEMSSKLKKL